ncbi:MAG: hypothetical protein ABIA21_02800 [Candidatus Aenigmatarchaeota archaeon]
MEYITEFDDAIRALEFTGYKKKSKIFWSRDLIVDCLRHYDRELKTKKPGKPLSSTDVSGRLRSAAYALFGGWDAAKYVAGLEFCPNGGNAGGHGGKHSRKKELSDTIRRFPGRTEKQLNNIMGRIVSSPLRQLLKDEDIYTELHVTHAGTYVYYASQRE